MYVRTDPRSKHTSKLRRGTRRAVAAALEQPRRAGKPSVHPPPRRRGRGAGVAPTPASPLRNPARRGANLRLALVVDRGGHRAARAPEEAAIPSRQPHRAPRPQAAAGGCEAPLAPPPVPAGVNRKPLCARRTRRSAARGPVNVSASERQRRLPPPTPGPAGDRGALHSRPTIREDRPGPQPVCEGGASPETRAIPSTFSTQRSHRRSTRRACDPGREIFVPDFERPIHSPEPPNTQNLSKLKNPSGL